MRRATATIHIANAAKLTPKQVKALAKWLRHKADKLYKERAEYAARYKATLHAG